MGLWYLIGNELSIQAFTNSDHEGSKLDLKRTYGGCQFLKGWLVSWSSKKQNYVSLLTAEEEYVDPASCCFHVLWIKSQHLDYGYSMLKVPIYCDSKSTITISHNPIQHSLTKNIHIRYHFFKDNVLKGNIEIIFVPIT